MKRLLRATLLIGLMLGIVIGASSCANDSTSHFGLVTKEIFGKISFDQGKTPAGLLVLVLSKDIGFIETAEGPLYETHASLGYVDHKGNYRIQLSDEMREVGIYFIAEGHINHRHDFSRSLGVGKIEYNIALKPSTNWDASFAVQLKPFLSGFIVEPRYKMPDSDELSLDTWIQKVEERINPIIQ